MIILRKNHATGKHYESTYSRNDNILEDLINEKMNSVLEDLNVKYRGAVYARN